MDGVGWGKQATICMLVQVSSKMQHYIIHGRTKMGPNRNIGKGSAQTNNSVLLETMVACPLIRKVVDDILSTFREKESCIP